MWASQTTTTRIYVNHSHNENFHTYRRLFKRETVSYLLSELLMAPTYDELKPLNMPTLHELTLTAIWHSLNQYKPLDSKNKEITLANLRIKTLRLLNQDLGPG